MASYYGGPHAAPSGSAPGGGGVGSGFYSSGTGGTGGGAYGSASASSSAYPNVASWQPQAAASTSSQQQQQQQQSHGQSTYGGGGTNMGYDFYGGPVKPLASQQQTAAFTPSVWNPAAAAAMAAVAGSMTGGPGGFTNDAVFQSLSTAGQSFFQQGTARMIPGFESTMLLLRTYFAVDNRYVMRKIQKVLFPFLSNNWTRQIKQHAGPDLPTQYDLPINDENAPDLYIPCMSLITYVLLCAVCYGTAGQFNPEIIPDVTQKCFLTQVLEVLAIRLGFYLMQTPVAMLDLFSYTGYKYLGLCVNLMIGMCGSQLQLGMRAYYVAFVWTAAAAAFFMLKTLANNIPLETAAAGPKREVVVFSVAAAQLATMWFVGQTKFL